MSAPWALALQRTSATMWHGAGTLFGFSEEEKATVVHTNRSLVGFGFKSKSKQEHTTGGSLLLLFSLISFLIAVVLIVVAGLVFLVEAPVRHLTGNPGPAPRDRAAETAPGLRIQAAQAIGPS